MFERPPTVRDDDWLSLYYWIIVAFLPVVVFLTLVMYRPLGDTIASFSVVVLATLFVYIACKAVTDRIAAPIERGNAPPRETRGRS